MTPLRTRDRVFIVFVVPVAILAAYVYYWRIPHAAKVKEDREKCEKLIKREVYAEEKAKLDKRLAETAAELEKEKATPPPAAAIDAAAGDGVAKRERTVLDIFREAGLRVVSTAAASVTPQRGGDVLRGTALRPDPRMRRYQLEGSYASLLRALSLFTERKSAVLVERVETSGGENWTVILWL